MADYKYKIQKYEQEILALQANVSEFHLNDHPHPWKCVMLNRGV